jgi:hypothetical protein
MTLSRIKKLVKKIARPKKTKTISEMAKSATSRRRPRKAK